MTDLLPDAPGLPRPSRRAILGATWTAPVVVAASAAPGYAASASATLRFDTLTSYPTTWAGRGPTRIETQVQVQHVWAANAPTVSGLTVSVVFPGSVAAGGTAAVDGKGWTAGSVTGSAAKGWTYTFSYADTLAPSASTAPLTFVVGRRDVDQRRETVTAYAGAPQAPTVTATTTRSL